MKLSVIKQFEIKKKIKIQKKICKNESIVNMIEWERMKAKQTEGYAAEFYHWVRIDDHYPCREGEEDAEVVKMEKWRILCDNLQAPWIRSINKFFSFHYESLRSVKQHEHKSNDCFYG